jgi:5-methylcytosine-specific restriction protein A
MDKIVDRESLFDYLSSIKWVSADCNRMTMLMPKCQVRYLEAINHGVSLSLFEGREESILRSLLKMGVDNYNYVNSQPKNVRRREAQRVLAKKNIRDWVFRRDGYACLWCGATQKLAIDHINPIKNGGTDHLSNLQTLCKSCNSKKSGTYKDFR